jgi:flagellar hook assembly protein FlgD
MDIFALQIGPDGTIPTGVGDTPPASAVALRSNYPNPFSAGTTFDLDLSVDANVVVDVYDVAGQKVRHVELGRLSAGSRAMPFDGAGEDGRYLPSGVYFYRVSANGATVTRKMVIAR